MNDEKFFLDYLAKNKFDKQLKKLEKKFNGKSIVLYGAGAFFEVLKANYDLSKLNIVAIADKRFENEGDFLGYKAIPPEKIEELAPDCVLVSTLKFVNIIAFLTCDLLAHTKIKVKPLVSIPFLKLIREIWNT